MKTYSYLALDIWGDTIEITPRRNIKGNLEEILSQLGAEGWEAYSYVINGENEHYRFKMEHVISPRIVCNVRPLDE